MKIKTSQHGFTLLEIMLVIGLASIFTLMKFYDQKNDLEQSAANETGRMLASYNNGVRSWLSVHPGATNAIQEGTKWMKSTTCGGTSSVAHLPCDFPDASQDAPLQFGRLTLISTIQTTGSSPNQITTVTTQSSPFTVGNQIRSDLAGISAVVAAVSGLKSERPILMATDGRYTSSPSTGIITMLASSNSSTDIWLRTDGSNTMNANIGFNPALSPTLRQINNLSRIQALASEIFYIGNPGGALASHSVVVDANQALLGTLSLENQAASGNALSITRGNIRVASGHITAAGNISASGNVIAGGNVEATGSIQGTVFYDANDTMFYINPNGTSQIADMLLVNQVVEGTACPQSGLISRKSSGATLSCDNGRWTSALPSGLYFYMNANSCPSGWAAADGTNGTLDLRGEFIRGADQGRMVDPGRVVGTWQDDLMKSHNHSMTFDRDRGPGVMENAVLGDETYYDTQTEYTSYTGGSETRPRNVAMLLCMKL